ncbi:MAG: UbiA family prenyltransferase, partial [Chloroflexi bacterium]|nr:UbiA family prenyltransferase [Chloroflexota bacterium]
MAILQTVRNYIEVLKPRETGLLTFIGISAAIIAGSGQPPAVRLLLASITILLMSAGVNGLTNYLDRHVDARMERTRNRVLPSGRIRPSEKVLPLLLSLTGAGLVMAWSLNPLGFLHGFIGAVAA